MNKLIILALSMTLLTACSSETKTVVVDQNGKVIETRVEANDTKVDNSDRFVKIGDASVQGKGVSRDISRQGNRMYIHRIL